MNIRMFSRAAGCALVAGLLSACGGGGGGGSDTAGGSTPPTASTTSFALSTGYRTRAASAAADNFNVSGTCAGSAMITTDAAKPSTFEGVTGYSAAQVSTVSFSNCLPATGITTGTTYFDSNYLPIGLSIVGGEYSKYESPPSALPATVKVGASADFAALTTYVDSTKSVVTGRRVWSYLIEADTASTVIANIVTRGYNVSGQLLSTQQTRYRMVESGALTLLSIDVQFSTTSTVHIVYMPR